jgi:hypothetical protein
MVYQMSDKKINAIEKKAKKDLEESTNAQSKTTEMTRYIEIYTKRLQFNFTIILLF